MVLPEIEEEDEDHHKLSLTSLLLGRTTFFMYLSGEIEVELESILAASRLDLTFQSPRILLLTLDSENSLKVHLINIIQMVLVRHLKLFYLL